MRSPTSSSRVPVSFPDSGLRSPSSTYGAASLCASPLACRPLSLAASALTFLLPAHYSQLTGFIGLTITLCSMGFGYDKLKENAVGAFVFLYCLTNFLQNYGPNSTTFVVPAEVFPTRYRSTAHGISGAQSPPTPARRPSQLPLTSFFPRSRLWQVWRDHCAGHGFQAQGVRASREAELTRLPLTDLFPFLPSPSLPALAVVAARTPGSSTCSRCLHCSCSLASSPPCSVRPSFLAYACSAC